MFDTIEEAPESSNLTPAQFSMELILESQRNNLNIIDTVVAYCEHNELDMDDVIPLLDTSIQERIKVCGIEERYVLGTKTSKVKLF